MPIPAIPAAVAALLPVMGSIFTTGLGAALAPDAPEQAKPNLPGASSPAPIMASRGPAAPFMGRQNNQTDQRQSAALAMLK